MPKDAGKSVWGDPGTRARGGQSTPSMSPAGTLPVLGPTAKPGGDHLRRGVAASRTRWPLREACPRLPACQGSRAHPPPLPGETGPPRSERADGARPSAFPLGFIPCVRALCDALERQGAPEAAVMELRKVLDGDAPVRPQREDPVALRLEARPARGPWDLWPSLVRKRPPVSDHLER